MLTPTPTCTRSGRQWLVLAALGCAMGAATAQTSSQTSNANPATPTPRASGGVLVRPAPVPEAIPTRTSPTGELNQAIERVRVDGDGVTVDELRVGGETRSIAVQPKGNFPSYSVQPRTGERTWKLFDF